jgi:hypothetical protein
MTVVVSGIFDAVESSGRFSPASQIRRGRFNVSIWGTFVATVKLERSFDDGVTWLVCSKPDLSDAAFTFPVTFAVEEPEADIYYRLTCSAFTSGTVNYRMSR